MTQEDKKLLLTDICARLPYGLMFALWNDYHKEFCWEVQVSGLEYANTKPIFVFDKPSYRKHGIETIKPYLRRISSMTDEEKSEYANFWSYDEYDESILTPEDAVRCGDWLDAHFFDYRGLLEKGLALEAPSGMYAALNKETHTPMTVEEAKAFIRQHNVVHPKCRQCKESFCDGCAETVDRELVNDVISGKINESNCFKF